MATPIQKMRNEMRLQMKELMSSKGDRIASKIEISKMSDEKKKFVDDMLNNRKMNIDTNKLESTIKKAAVPIKKKEIVVIDFVPVHKPVVSVVAIELCKAKNLNGTPCKCRAKIGKFCAKHAP